MKDRGYILYLSSGLLLIAIYFFGLFTIELEDASFKVTENFVVTLTTVGIFVVGFTTSIVLKILRKQVASDVIVLIWFWINFSALIVLIIMCFTEADETRIWNIFMTLVLVFNMSSVGYSFIISDNKSDLNFKKIADQRGY